MTKLDLILERIRQLPQDRQDAIAVDLEIILEDEAQGSLLTDAQWADLRQRMAEPQGDPIPHTQIVAEFEAKFRKCEWFGRLAPEAISFELTIFSERIAQEAPAGLSHAY